MKKLALFLGLVLGTVSLSVIAAPQFGNRTATRVCVYEHNNFSGWERCFVPGERIEGLTHGRGFI